MNYVKKLLRKLDFYVDCQAIYIISEKSNFQFDYKNAILPLVWMLCSRTSNNMINKLHDRSLITVLNDYSSDYNELLENNKDICGHHSYIHTLSIKVFKMKNELAPSTIEPMLDRSVNTYNLRNFHGFVTDRKRTVW